VESMYDPNVVNRAAVVLKDMIAEHGHQFAIVTPELRRIPPSSLEVVFNVNEGPTVKVGDIIEVKEHKTSRAAAQKSMESSTARVVPDWVEVDRENLRARLLRIPTREEINPIANEQAVVEFYSR